MSTMKHLLSQILEGVLPLIPNLALGPNNQGGWRHADAVDWSDHAKYWTEDGVQHLEEREDVVCLGESVSIVFVAVNEGFVAVFNHRKTL